MFADTKKWFFGKDVSHFSRTSGSLCPEVKTPQNARFMPSSLKKGRLCQIRAATGRKRRPWWWQKSTWNQSYESGKNTTQMFSWIFVGFSDNLGNCLGRSFFWGFGLKFSKDAQNDGSRSSVLRGAFRAWPWGVPSHLVHLYGGLADHFPLWIANQIYVDFRFPNVAKSRHESWHLDTCQSGQAETFNIENDRHRCWDVFFNWQLGSRGFAGLWGFEPL